MERQNKINQIIHNSNLLCRALGIDPKDLEKMSVKFHKDEEYDCIVYRTPKYDVQIQNRCFRPWIYVLEITPTGTSSFNGERCFWVNDMEGTCTLNLAPDEIINEVITDIHRSKLFKKTEQKSLISTIADWIKQKYFK